MSITSIAIRNFRSIASFNESVQDLNIFVGQNDEGKSNILRALDLFFNHDKNNGYQFEWARDYCSFALKRDRKAEEIEISIVIKPPPSFTDHKPVIWKKYWRRGGFYRETRMHEDKAEINPKSKIAAFLKAMRFDYVPAIKGNDYFQTLMSKLHDMLEATVAENVRAASGSFTKTINENIQPILDQVLKRLGLQTTIELPENLRSLFAQLEFTSVSSDKSFSLNQRGDGIKVRHIPIVLRWLADQANHLSAKGKPKTVTVWGYEEPENNLELRRCFELAQEFVESASEIQAFVTTHSPAFYSVFRDSDQSKVGLFLVAKDHPQPTTNVVRLKVDSEITSLDSSMGLMALLEPHFKEVRQENERLQTTLDIFKQKTKPVLLVEGVSDVTHLEEAWTKLKGTKVIPFEIIPCGIDIAPEKRSGGAEMLRRCLEFLTIASDRKIAAMFDNDRAGNEQFAGVNAKVFGAGLDEFHKKHKSKQAHAILLPIPAGREAFVTVADKGQRYLSIEHYFSNQILDANGMKGGGILGTDIFEIVGNKVNFATRARKLDASEFAHFNTLFNRLESLGGWL